MESGVLYKPQIGPEHRKLIERHKRVRENLADPFVEPLGFASKVPEKPIENQSKEPERPAGKKKRATLSWEDIVDATSVVLSSGKITIGDVVKPYKNLDIVEVRSVVVYLMHQDLKLGGAPMSFVEIGKRLGGRTNATTLHAWRKINRRLETDKDLRTTLEKIRTMYI